MRRGQLSALGQVVIAAVVLILIIFLIVMVRRAQITKVMELQCTQSIQSHILNTKMFLPPEPIECPTQYVGVGAESKMEVNARLAREQVLCWHQWFKGEENLFVEDEGVFCHACYVNEFANKHTKIDDYIDYIKSHRISDVANEVALFERRDPLIIDYIMPYSSESFEAVVGEEEAVLEDLKVSSLDTSNDLAVVFFYVKGEARIHDFAEKLFVGSLIVDVSYVGWVVITAKISAISTFHPVGLIVAGVAAVGLTVATLILREEQLQARLSGTTIVPWTENTLTDLHCEYIPVDPGEANT